MIAKSAVLFTLLCVVNGNVVINVFEDDGAEVMSEQQSSIQSCSLAWCEQTCHRMGFPGGVCVGDRCKCDILEGTRAEVMSEQPSSVQSCSLAWCEQTCHRMGFPGGVCVGDRCKCDILEGTRAEVMFEQQSSVQSCSLAWCEQTCHRMGFPGGVCVGDKCKCDILDDNHLVAEPALQECKDRCNSQCLKLGNSGGVCHGDTCYCGTTTGTTHKFRKPVKPMHKLAIKKHGTQSAVQICNNCNRICQSLDFLQGVCLFDEDCYCRVGKPKSCSLYCSIICKGFGFQGGICRDDDCFCGPTDKVHNSTKTLDKLTVINPDTESVQACSDYCDDLCRSMGFPGGTCNGETCYCGGKDHIRLVAVPPKSVDRCEVEHCSAHCSEQSSLYALCSNNRCYCINYHADGALEASAPGQVCAHSPCNKFCRDMHYFRGTCSNDTCKCHKLHALQSKGREHLNKICLSFECDQGCKRMGYARGMCIGNDCKCSSFVQEDETDNDIPDEDVSDLNKL